MLTQICVKKCSSMDSHIQCDLSSNPDSGSHINSVKDQPSYLGICFLSNRKTPVFSLVPTLIAQSVITATHRPLALVQEQTAALPVLFCDD